MDTLVKGCQLLGIPLSERQTTQFRVYSEELVAWNRRVNLTSITDPEGIQTRHFLDSASCLLAFPGVEIGRSSPFLASLPSFQGLKVIDVGSGAGFPGFPLKIIRPEIELTLLESVGKKISFLEHVVRKLDLSGVELAAARAEEAAQTPRHREKYDVVVSRALAGLPVLAELCLPFARIGGRVVAPKKGDIEPELRAGAGAISLLGGRLAEKIAVELPGFLDLRYLIVVDKVASTPAQYPRRPGVPAKRPLK